ncbi:hypothetical protein DES40_0481 [Litorimonas taeanensis]|uniref:Uncharacterized protein n=1 Tax=Litorimonas taeanensis TaxID=568099 RepID=A0A420WJI2_9PROT|nr:hypothetical protein DES40_0481 [Litorimonas taeanensis]
MTDLKHKTGFWKKLWLMLETMSASDCTQDTYVLERIRAQETRIANLELKLSQD